MRMAGSALAPARFPPAWASYAAAFVNWFHRGGVGL